MTRDLYFVYNILMKTLVLRLGNELYGDDGTGIHVIKELRSKIETEKKLSMEKTLPEIINKTIELVKQNNNND